MLLDPIAIDKGYYPTAEMSQLAKLGAFFGTSVSTSRPLWHAILATAKSLKLVGTKSSFCHVVSSGLCFVSWPVRQSHLKIDILHRHALGESFGGQHCPIPWKPLLILNRWFYAHSVSMVWPCGVRHATVDKHCHPINIAAIASVEHGQIDKDIFLISFDEARKDNWQKGPLLQHLEEVKVSSSTWQTVLTFVPDS